MARRSVTESAEPTPLWRQLFSYQFLIVVFLALGTLAVLFLATYFGRTSDAPIQTFAVAADAAQETDRDRDAGAFRLAQSPARAEIAIVAGHLESDSGAVCDDGLTEQSVNLDVARRVVDRLADAGHSAAVFAEFDGRLTTFAGTLLVSIHADSCDDFGPDATGFKIAASGASGSAPLKACVFETYAAATGLRYHANTVTLHMTDYHAFRELPEGTPAIIIETGFLGLDRPLLTEQADLPAAGIAEGILCYLEKYQ